MRTTVEKLKAFNDDEMKGDEASKVGLRQAT